MYEALNIVRVSGNVISEILGTYIIPSDAKDPKRSELISIAEEHFIQAKINDVLEGDEREEAIENGYYEEDDGDTVCLSWSHIFTMDLIKITQVG